MDPNLPNQPTPPVQSPIPAQPVPPVQTPMSQASPVSNFAEAPLDGQPAPVIPPAPKKVSGVLIAGLVLLFISILALVGYYLIQTKQLKIGVTSPTATPEPTVEAGTPTPTATPNPTANWQTYNSAEFNFSFKYPTDYQLSQPVSGGEAPTPGSFTFLSATKGKGDMFFVDVTPFTGTLDQFVTKYTPYDSTTKTNTVSLHVTTSNLGTLLEKSDINSNPVAFYSYTNHYDQTINPGATDITTYSAFFILGKEGFIVRASGIESLTKLKQILSTFQFTEASASASATPLSSPSSTPSATPI